MTKGQATGSTPHMSPRSLDSLELLDVPLLKQTASLSSSADALSGRNGLTKNVAASKPMPMKAWRALVNGLLLMGPMVKTTMDESAVM